MRVGRFMSAGRGRAPKVTTLVAQAHPRPYRIQWERVLRWRKRTGAAIAVDDCPLDFLLVLFTNVLHMHDWLATSKPELKNDVSALFSNSPNLGVARDLANGSKHMVLSSYSIDGAATVAREYAGAGGSRYVVPRPGGANMDAKGLR